MLRPKVLAAPLESVMATHREADRPDVRRVTPQAALIVGPADQAVEEEGRQKAARFEQFVAAELRRDPSRADGIKPGPLPIVGHRLANATGAFLRRRDAVNS